MDRFGKATILLMAALRTAACVHPPPWAPHADTSLAPGVVWEMPFHSPLSGQRCGVAAVVLPRHRRLLRRRFAAGVVATSRALRAFSYRRARQPASLRVSQLPAAGTSAGTACGAMSSCARGLFAACVPGWSGVGISGRPRGLRQPAQPAGVANACLSSYVMAR